MTGREWPPHCYRGRRNSANKRRAIAPFAHTHPLLTIFGGRNQVSFCGSVNARFSSRISQNQLDVAGTVPDFAKQNGTVPSRCLRVSLPADRKSPLSLTCAARRIQHRGAPIQRNPQSTIRNRRPHPARRVSRSPPASG
jgi:hypothetical protein